MVGGEAVPRRQFLGAGGEFGVLRNDAELFLPGEGFRAHLVPALIELAAVCFDPGFRHVVRRVHGAGGEIDEERAVGPDRIVFVHPVHRIVYQIGGQVIAILEAAGRVHRGGVAIQQWLALAAFAPHEAVEIVEAEAGWPMIERAGRADFPDRRVVPLAVGGGGVAVFAQDFGDAGGILVPDRVVAGKARGDVLQVAEAGLVLVVAGQQGGAGGRADGGGVEIVVAEALRRELVEFRRGRRSAKRSGGAEAHIVEQDQHDVGRGVGSRDLAGPVWHGLEMVRVGFAVERRLRFWQHFLGAGLLQRKCADGGEHYGERFHCIIL